MGVGPVVAYALSSGLRAAARGIQAAHQHAMPAAVRRAACGSLRTSLGSAQISDVALSTAETHAMFHRPRQTLISNAELSNVVERRRPVSLANRLRDTA
jgi:hypothetical protein